MNMIKKSLAVVSALFLLAACETPSGSSSSADGSGNAAGGSGLYANAKEIAPGVIDRVFFEYDSAVITMEGQGTLERQAAWMKQNPNVSVTMEGHCDERGTREYNLALGERRAAAAKKYLVGMGIASSRISTISYGKERPAIIGSDESAWSQNRRAVTVIGN